MPSESHNDSHDTIRCAIKYFGTVILIAALIERGFSCMVRPRKAGKKVFVLVSPGPALKSLLLYITPLITVLIRR